VSRSSGRWHGELLYALLLVAAAAVVFYYRQNHAGQVGGPISVEKILWLHYAIVAWYVIPAGLLRHPALAPSLRVILGSFLASMLARGVIELWLIYVAFGWSPLYGIAHNLTNMALFAVLCRRHRAELAGLRGFDVGVRRFVGSIRLSLVAESVFALLFYRMQVHQEAIYFASPTEAFAHINLLTRWVDAVVYTDLAIFLWRYRQALFRRPPALAPLPAA
jgi:hypothetical protein